MAGKRKTAAPRKLKRNPVARSLRSGLSARRWWRAPNGRGTRRASPSIPGAWTWTRPGTRLFFLITRRRPLRPAALENLAEEVVVADPLGVRVGSLSRRRR